MERDAIRDTVLKLAKEELGDKMPPSDAELSDTLDSVQLLALVVAVEDHFEVAFEPGDDEQARTLEDVVDLVAGHLESGA